MQTPGCTDDEPRRRSCARWRCSRCPAWRCWCWSAVAGALALRSLATSEAVRQAKPVTTVHRARHRRAGAHHRRRARRTAARSRGSTTSCARRVLAPDVARVKIWNAEGKILYSDEPRLIGRRFVLAPDELQACAAGPPPPSSDLSRPRERLRAPSRQADVGLPRPARPRRHAGAVRGVPALERDRRQQPQRRPAVRAGRDRARCWCWPRCRSRWPGGWPGGSETPSATASSCSSTRVDASDRERQLIAAGLHDGVVQELAGHSFQMAAAVEQDRPPSRAAPALTEGAAGTRNAIRQLRSLLLEIYPPALRDQGLAAALPDLAAPLTAGASTSASTSGRSGAAHRGRAARVPHRPGGGPERRRTRRRRPRPDRLERSNGLVRLRVSDDGRGFDAGRPGRAAGRRPPRPGHAARPGRRRPAARCR